MSEELKNELTEAAETLEAAETKAAEVAESAAEAVDEAAENAQPVDESVQIIREVSEAKAEQATNVSPELIKTGDKVFSTLLTTVPVIVGIIMILAATFSGPGEKAGLVVVGMIFFLFGLLLQFLSRHVKKD